MVNAVSVVSRTLDARRRRALLMGAGGIGAAVFSLASYVRYLNQKIEENREKTRQNAKQFKIKIHKSKKKQMAAKFWSRVSKVLSICVPSVFSKECLFLFAQLLTLYLRSMASILVAKLDGMIVQAIISKKFGKFVTGLGYWMILALPAVFINSMIRYFTGQISLSFRARLVEYAQNKYLANQTYYRVLNLDSRLNNADQMITTDITRMCDKLSKLYTDLCKPAMDLFIYSWTLHNAIGWQGPSLLATFYFCVGSALRFASPPFGELAADQSALEGMFSFVHSRLIQNSEEIAFYRGEEVEHGYLKNAFEDLKHHIRNMLTLKVPYSVLEKFSLKYVASVLIFFINAAPVFFGEDDAAERAGTYMSQRRMLLDLADAIQRVMESYKEVMEVSGYVARVCEMLEVFEDVEQNRYEKAISEANREAIENFEKQQAITKIDKQLKFEKVPIVTPNGDVLIRSLDMKLEKDMHLIICGPNGCGKSSLFRTIGGLWQLQAGTLTRPDLSDMIWIPQNAYLSLGTLKEQIIYPHTSAEFDARGGTIEDLEKIMEHVNLSYVVERENGWDSKRNWKDRLSGGEKQRVGMARMFYHRPSFAILDECTSQVSIDWEGKMYTHAKDLGIQLITVSHRTTLHRYHSHVLRMDGEGGYSFETIEKGIADLNAADSKAELLAQQNTLKLKLEEVNQKLADE